MAGPLDNLFRQASKALRESALRDFKRSNLGKAVDEARKGYQRGAAMPAEISRIAQRYGKQFQARNVLKDLMGKEMGDLVSGLHRYAKSGGLSKMFVDQFLESLGPAGKLMRALVETGTGKTGTIQKDLQLAANLLEQFGWITIPPPGTKRVGSTKLKESGVPGMIEALRAMGYTVIPPTEEVSKKAQGKAQPTPAKQEPQAQPSRILKKYPKNHPVNTGEMVLARNSSNVHSYGYDLDSAYLYVRFLGEVRGESGERKRQGPGSLYRYAGVRPSEFIRLHDAHSKGKWVWSNLRIRGTVSGHRKDYELVGVVSNYVPRKATIGPEGEIFIKRTVRTLEGKFLRSALPNILVRPLSPTRPSKPTPPRGKP